MNPFQVPASALATAKLVVLGLVVALVVGYVGNVFYKAKKLDVIEQRDSQTAKALKGMGAEAKKRESQESAHFKRNQAAATALSKELSNENAEFDDRRRADYHRVLNDALRGTQ